MFWLSNYILNTNSGTKGWQNINKDGTSDIRSSAYIFQILAREGEYVW